MNSSSPPLHTASAVDTKDTTVFLSDAIPNTVIKVEGLTGSTKSFELPNLHITTDNENDSFSPLKEEDELLLEKSLDVLSSIHGNKSGEPITISLGSSFSLCNEDRSNPIDTEHLTIPALQRLNEEFPSDIRAYFKPDPLSRLKGTQFNPYSCQYEVRANHTFLLDFIPSSSQSWSKINHSSKISLWVEHADSNFQHHRITSCNSPKHRNPRQGSSVLRICSRNPIFTSKLDDSTPVTHVHRPTLPLCLKVLCLGSEHYNLGDKESARKWVLKGNLYTSEQTPLSFQVPFQSLYLLRQTSRLVKSVSSPRRTERKLAPRPPRSSQTCRSTKELIRNITQDLHHFPRPVLEGLSLSVNASSNIFRQCLPLISTTPSDIRTVPHECATESTKPVIILNPTTTDRA